MSSNQWDERQAQPFPEVIHPYEPTPTTQAAPPAWHPDPHAPGMLRYWDGVQWTTRVAPQPAPAAVPVALAQPISGRGGSVNLGFMFVGVLSLIGTLIPALGMMFSGSVVGGIMWGMWGGMWTLMWFAFGTRVGGGKLR